MYKNIIVYLTFLLFLISNTIYVYRPSIVFRGFGIISNNVLTSSIFILDLLVVFNYLFIALKQKNAHVEKVYVYLFNILGIVLILLFTYLNYLESTKFPNYVYSMFHIYLPALSNFSKVFILGLFINIFKIIYSKRDNILSNQSTKRKNALILVEGTIILIFGLTLLKIPKVLVSDTKYVYKNLSTSKKVLSEMPKLKLQLEEVKTRTPPGSIIIHPDQSALDPELGNQVLIRYVLYPRTLVSSSKYETYLHNKKPTDKVFWISARPLELYNLLYSNSELQIYIYE